MEIKPEHVAVITYELRIKSGELVDEAREEQPFAFIHGIGTTLEAFDKFLIGKKAGDSFDFKLSQDEAYGPYYPENVVEIPIENFEGAPEGTLDLGNTVPMQGPDNQTLFGTVVAADDQKVKMDFNLPLAGHDLHFTGKVLEVRPATRTELEHGHVHGAHGHHH